MFCAFIRGTDRSGGTVLALPWVIHIRFRGGGELLTPQHTGLEKYTLEGLHSEMRTAASRLNDEAGDDCTTENCARRGDGLEAEFAEP